MPDCAYILGRRVFYKKDKIKHTHTNAFNRLAIVDFKNNDSKIISKTQCAIDWMKELKKYGKNWKLPIDLNNESNEIIDYTTVRTELLPNMCNTFDHPWHHVKKLYASRIFDITMLWNCSTKNRDFLFKKGIMSWMDTRCTSTSLGIVGKNKEILDGILSINRSNQAVIGYKNIKNLPFLL